MERIEITTGFTPADVEILKGFVGKKLIRMRHNPFNVTNVVFRVVEFEFDDSVFCLMADLDPIRYYETNEEEISCLHVVEGPDPFRMDSKIEEPVGATVEKVSIVTDVVNASLKDGTAVFLNEITDAVVLSLSNGKQLGFERLDDFIEGIIIHKGKNVIASFNDPEHWVDNSDGYFAATSATRRVDTFE